MMKQRKTLGAAMLVAVLLSVWMGSARAQTDADVAAVTAADNAFYTALSALDAAAMETVWAREPNVTSVGPRSKAVTTGSAAVQDGFKNFMSTVTQITLKPVDTQVRISGNVAWTIGREVFDTKWKDGTSGSGANLVSHVFEKKDGHWLMVSQHAQRVPQ